jgi:hypothetical protein
VRLVEEVKSGTERAIEPLLKVQRVVELQGRAGAMSRSAYEELGRLSEQASDPEVKVLASGAFLGIRAAHSFSRFREDLPFEVKGPDGVSLKNADIPDQDLLRLLGEGNDFERGMAATWLARKQNRCAVPALMRLLAHDGEPHLIALRHEIEAVRQLVPGIPAAGSSFDVDAVLGWWDVHSSDFSPCATSVEPPVDLSWLSGG